MQRKGTVLLVFAVLFFVLWLVHTSPWTALGLGSRPLPEALGWVKHTHYALLDRAFWSAVLAGAALACLFEGLVRRSRWRRLQGEG